MKIKATLTMLSAALALVIMAANAFSQNIVFSAPQNMGGVLNTAVNDQNMTLSPNGLNLYFASNRAGGLGGQDIVVSRRSALGAAWSAPQNLGATLNSTDSEAPMSFSLDGRTMFLQSNRAGGLGNQDLYISTRTNPNDDSGWSAPVNLGAVVNSPLFDTGANYFEDPATGAASIIFSSNRVGNPDVDFHLYQSTRNADGTFNAPVLISELGTMGGSAELRPALRRDGLEIFFASSRPGGLGLPPPGPPTFDIFVSTRTSTAAAWNPPVLVPGVNTTADDTQPSLSPDGSILYFHSTRTGGFGQTDLYAATRCSLFGAGAPCNVNRTIADFDGDGRADLSVFRPSESTWYVMESGTNTFRAQQFGINGDKIVPGDYDGDGRIDLGVFRPSDGNWYVKRSSDNMVSITNWGLASDRPVPGDYDGDGRTDIAVFREGVWYIVQSSNGAPNYQYFGLSTDIPVAATTVQ